MQLFDLTGKISIVTGASSGLGVQFAHALAEQGAAVAVVARRFEMLQAVAADINSKGGRCLPVCCDVRDEAQVKAAVAQIVSKFGTVDILVNNAGIVRKADTVPNSTTDDWDDVIATNLRGVYLFSHEVSSMMIQKRYGKIINISSVGGTLGGPNQLSYFASKAAVINLTRALACDLGPYNITVNSIGPGIFKTEMTAHNLDESNPNFVYLTGKIPLRRIGAEGDLNGLLIYFASDASRYTTGQNICVDGGMASIL